MWIDLSAGHAFSMIGLPRFFGTVVKWLAVWTAPKFNAPLHQIDLMDFCISPRGKLINLISVLQLAAEWF